MKKHKLKLDDLETLEIKDHWPLSLCRADLDIFSSVMESSSEEQLQDLFERYIRLESTEENLKIDAYLNGEKVEGQDIGLLYKNSDVPFLSFLGSLDYSLRLVNIQKLWKEVKAAGQSFFHRHGLVLTCNMYITPNSTKNCFKFHADYQQSFIQQIIGEKKWSFPIDPETKDYKINAKNRNFSQDHEEVNSLDLRKGDVIYIGHSLMHKAQCGKQGVSIHLTWSVLGVNQYDLLKTLSQELFSVEDSELREMLGSTMLDMDFLEDRLHRLRQSVNSLDLEKILDNFNSKKDGLDLYHLKKGRRY